MQQTDELTVEEEDPEAGVAVPLGTWTLPSPACNDKYINT